MSEYRNKILLEMGLTIDNVPTDNDKLPFYYQVKDRNGLEVVGAYGRQALDEELKLVYRGFKLAQPINDSKGD